MRERIFGFVKLGQLDSASGFIALAERNWMDIKEDKILNLPLNRITIAEAFCIRNAAEKFRLFREDKQWLQIQQEVKSSIVEGFGNDASSILDHYISKYDEETLYLEESQRNKQRDHLTQLLLKDMEKPYLSLVENMRDKSSADFQKEIVEKIRKGCSKFEKNKRDECITQFKSLLADAHIKQAKWDYTHEHLGILKSDMTYNEAAAAYIVKVRKEIQEMKTRLWSTTTAVGVTTVAALIGIGATLSATGGLAAASLRTAARNVATAAAATGVPTASSIFGLIPLHGDIQKKELELKEACKRDPVINALVNQI